MYVGRDGTIHFVDAAFTTTGVFSTVSTGDLVAGILFDPLGEFLFLNRSSFALTIIRRDGTLVQDIPMSSSPDGIAFRSTAPKFVVTNNLDGTMTRFDFPGDDFTQVPVQSVFASGGHRGDLIQAGPDGCLFVTQAGTRYDNGTVTGENSLVRICSGSGGFDLPPGVPPPPPASPPAPPPAPDADTAPLGLSNPQSFGCELAGSGDEIACAETGATLPFIRFDVDIPENAGFLQFDYTFTGADGAVSGADRLHTPGRSDGEDRRRASVGDLGAVFIVNVSIAALPASGVLQRRRVSKLRAVRLASVAQGHHVHRELPVGCSGFRVPGPEPGTCGSIAVRRNASASAPPSAGPTVEIS